MATGVRYTLVRQYDILCKYDILTKLRIFTYATYVWSTLYLRYTFLILKCDAKEPLQEFRAHWHGLIGFNMYDDGHVNERNARHSLSCSCTFTCDQKLSVKRRPPIIKTYFIIISPKILDSTIKIAITNCRSKVRCNGKHSKFSIYIS